MINGDFYGREMWIAFHSIAAKYVLLSKLLTLTLIVQSTLPSFQLQSVGYSWLVGWVSLTTDPLCRKDQELMSQWASQRWSNPPLEVRQVSKRQEFLAQGTTNKAWYRDYVNPHQPLRSDENFLDSQGVHFFIFLFRNILQAHVILNHTAPCHMWFPCRWCRCWDCLSLISRISHLPFSWKLLFPLSCFLAHLEVELPQLWLWLWLSQLFCGVTLVNSFVSACLPPVQQPMLHHAMPCYLEGVW